jgi:predicted alpha-1,6-mannanase (GH76 family)
MTPKEKAIDLFVKYYERLPNDTYSNEGAKSEAKECALIAVDEILKDREEIDGMRVINDPYWSKVKEEIKNL